jgi:2-polyprenyl-6-hydroxyphenyl methylase/3-demethylubiquinone-9 3-methyltransferase
MSNVEPKADHSEAFIDYYERASASAATVNHFTRVRNCALRLRNLQEPAASKVFNVIDIGCGAGTQALVWAKLGHRVAALDASQGLLAIGAQRARTEGVDIAFCNGLAQSLPFADSAFDFVLLPQLLEHVDSWEACLSEAARVLKPGGVVFVSTTNRLCPAQQEFSLSFYSWYPTAIKRWCVRKALTTRPDWVNHTKFPAVNWFTYSELRQWFEARGFQTMDRFDVLDLGRMGFGARLLVTAIRNLSLIRLLAQCASRDTTLWGLKLGN